MKKINIALLIVLLMAGPVAAATNNLVGTSSPFVYTLLSAATGTGAGDTITALRPVPRTFFATVTGTGAVSATVYIEVSGDGVNYLTGANSLCTLTLSGTTTATDGCAVPAAMWPYIRANVNAISGTSAAVTVRIGG